MSERESILTSVGYFEVEQESSVRLQPVLECMPQPEVRKQELDIREDATPLALRELASKISEFLEQPIDTAILKRYERGGPESSSRQPYQAHARFAGRIALVSLSGRANLFAFTGPDEKAKWVSCRPGTIVYMDAIVPRWVSPPLTSEPRQTIFFGHDTTKTEHPNAA